MRTLNWSAFFLVILFALGWTYWENGQCRLVVSTLWSLIFAEVWDDNPARLQKDLADSPNLKEALKAWQEFNENKDKNDPRIPVIGAFPVIYPTPAPPFPYALEVGQTK